MSSSSGFQPMPGWYWPDEPSQATSSPSSSSQPQSSTASATGETPRPGQGTRSSKRTHWPPRQCRICYETVQPTFNVPSENLPGFLQSSNVTYEDESGRLIRPCNCKGTSKYVHEVCLQTWRHADPSYGPRNYWHCPTCGFKYRLARLGVGRLVGSAAARVGLTLIILTLVIFALGFIADPIINMYFDPWSYLTPWSSRPMHDYYYEDDEPATWSEHFAKGFASMGVLGFLKVIIASPFSYFRFGGGRGRTGRDRYEQISWIIILIGVGTFLTVVYKGVSDWSRRTLERAGERVMDVQGDDNDDED